MEFSPATVRLLSELDRLSGGTLTRREDLAILLETGREGKLRAALDELGFLAKFLHSTRAIMARIGPGAEGYDRLAKEFSGNAERARSITATLVAAAPGEERRLTDTYLAMTHEGLENLLALCHDLGWYKNWLIDTRGTRRAGT